MVALVMRSVKVVETVAVVRFRGPVGSVVGGGCVVACGGCIGGQDGSHTPVRSRCFSQKLRGYIFSRFIFSRVNFKLKLIFLIPRQ